MLDKFLARVPDDNVPAAVAQAMLEDAEGLALGYMNRTTLPEACENAVVRLAVILYSRMGMEGETSRSEGGVSMAVDLLPADIKAQLRPYRLATTGG